MVHHIEFELKKYLSDFRHNKLALPIACERCKRRGHLIWWGKYPRNLITFSRVFTDIPIKRVRCSACGCTFCSLPNFITKFCHYGKDVIVYALRELKKATYEQVVGKLFSGSGEHIEIAVNTLSSWKKKYTIDSC
jgi:hypothetical protein